MDSLYAAGLEFIIWLQESYPQLEGFFLLVSELGNETFYLAVLPLIYWTINKRLGKQLGFLFFAAVGINTILKQAFRQPRPFWIDESVGLADTGGYGIPSGHTQYATVIYLLIAGWLANFWFWLLALFMIFIMSLSRIYLGQHFIQDVISGFLAGLFILAGYFIWARYFAKNFNKRILGQKVLAAVLVAVIIGLLYIIVLVIIGAPDLSVPWADYIPEAELASKTEMARTFGALLGFSVGALLEGSRVRFRVDGSFTRRAIRYLFGIIVMVIIWQGLGFIFPREPLWLGIPLYIIRYGLITLWGAYFAPMAFVRLHLAEADPPPSIDMKL